MTVTAVRRAQDSGIIRYAISPCFLSEKEMKDAGLIPFYRSKTRPEMLLFALQQAEPHVGKAGKKNE
jgi:hypothetical protein